MEEVRIPVHHLDVSVEEDGYPYLLTQLVPQRVRLVGVHGKVVIHLHCEDRPVDVLRSLFLPPGPISFRGLLLSVSCLSKLQRPSGTPSYWRSVPRTYKVESLDDRHVPPLELVQRHLLLFLLVPTLLRLRPLPVVLHSHFMSFLRRDGKHPSDDLVPLRLTLLRLLHSVIGVGPLRPGPVLG